MIQVNTQVEVNADVKIAACRKVYSTPQLIEYGSIAELTQGGDEVGTDFAGSRQGAAPIPIE